MRYYLPIAMFTAGVVCGLVLSAYRPTTISHASSSPIAGFTLTSAEPPNATPSPQKPDAQGPHAIPSPRRSDLVAPDARDVRVPLTEYDRRMIAFQKTCPVCAKELDAKRQPGRVELTLYVCGRDCIAKFNEKPRETITKWADICHAHASNERSNTPKSQ